MNYPFRMYGEIVEIYRYKINYTEQLDPEGEPEAVTNTLPTKTKLRPLQSNTAAQ